MRFQKSLLLFALLSWTLDAYGEENRGRIHVLIENLKSSKGQVRVRLFNRAEGFPIAGDKAIESRMLSISEGRVETIFTDLPYGDYAVGALHDENGNGRMDLKWGMWPAEGVGASNNPEPGLTPTNFDRARVRLEGEELKVNIHIHY